MIDNKLVSPNQRYEFSSAVGKDTPATEDEYTRDEIMLEPDVTLTDLVLAVECGAFSLVLFRQTGEAQHVRRLYSALFGALGVSSLFGGLWHGVFSGPESAIGHWVWFCVMAALALAAALLWLLSAAIFSSAKWVHILGELAVLQLVLQVSVSVFMADSFTVAALGLLPPMSFMIAGHFVRFRQSRDRKALWGTAGFTLAALAGLVIASDVSLHPRWATTQAVYHMVQFVAFWLVFLSVPAVPDQPR